MTNPVVYYTSIENLEMEFPVSLLRSLPEFFQREILAYQKPDDRLRLLAGKLLLKKLISDFGYDESLLANYSADECHRPFIPGFRDFNITHSGQVVACSLLEGGRVGIDVEKIRKIEPEHFSKQFSPSEMNQIQMANEPLEKFFEFWTQKEAVMKADGRGMRIPLHSIHLLGNFATIEDRDETWYLTSLDLREGYKSHLCMHFPIGEVTLEKCCVL